MAQEPTVARDSAGLPIKPITPGAPSAPAAPEFVQLPVEGEDDLKLYFSAQPTSEKAVRHWRRKLRRERMQGYGESADRWLISYSDFITLLFAFFVVMYAISQINESKYRVLSESLVQAFRPQGNLEAKSVTENKIGQPSATPIPAGVIPQAPPRAEIPKEPPLPKLHDVELEIKRALDPLIKTGEAKVTSGTQGLSILLDAKVSFKPGEAALTFESFLPLKNITQTLRRNAHEVRVEGYVGDERIAPEYPSAWELSTARASRVVRYMIDSGMDPQRLSALGYGNARAATGNTRVGILVAPFGDEMAAKPAAGEALAPAQ